jgi:predicted RNase H-like nuclease (RuvC/YqgF family)
MSNGDYQYEAYQRELDQLRGEVADLESENRDLQYQLRQKDDRVYELEQALDSMRRELRYAEGDHHLDSAKKHGKRAVGGWW